MIYILHILKILLIVSLKELGKMMKYETGLSVFEAGGDILSGNDGWRPAESKTVRHGSYL